MMRRPGSSIGTLLSLLIGLSVLVGGVPVERACAQSAGENGGEEEESAYFDYEPYRRDEFPQWAHKLRRFETLLIGSLPFSFFFTNIGYDSYTYIDRGYDEDYLPLFFGSNPEKEELRYESRQQRLIISLSISTGIALLDYFIGRAREE